ncbi:uncharacterized protein LOC143198296 [Rhynchophorus ferrugineus]|uniref:Uncharacterized protein n=1 Tax=Rhynchophorus ferrugineus TaxID=354439 RepID=A0A834HRJ9_RHYFE|nr:hypothetical protein GWI33_020815 [Rhynchophorus ferrugineus]
MNTPTVIVLFGVLYMASAATFPVNLQQSVRNYNLNEAINSGQYIHDDSGSYKPDDSGRYVHQDVPYVHIEGPSGGFGDDGSYKDSYNYEGDNDGYKYPKPTPSPTARPTNFAPIPGFVHPNSILQTYLPVKY